MAVGERDVAESRIGWCSAAAAGLFLSRRDREFVGAEPGLEAELARRSAPRLRARFEPPPPPDPVLLLRMCQEGGLPPVDCQRTAPPARDSRRMKDRKGEGHTHNFKQFPLDWNHTNVYAMQLKVAEQAIYSVQIRLAQYEKMVERHGQDERFRIAYVMKKLESWGREISILYDYSHQNNTPFCCISKWDYPGWYWSWAGRYVRNTYDNPIMFSVYRHIVYYQLILRRYIDIVYTLEHLMQMHTNIFTQHKDKIEALEQMKQEMLQAMKEGAKTG